MPEPIVIMDNKVCPICHKPGTVAQRAFKRQKESGKLPSDVFVGINMTIKPLEMPLLAGITVETIVIYEDICISCGTKYFTRAQLIQSPVTAENLPGNMPKRS
jgi:hypothetical protein